MRGEILTFPDTLTTQGLSLLCFNIVGGEILTFPDTLTTAWVIPTWCFNIVVVAESNRNRNLEPDRPGLGQIRAMRLPPQ